MPTEDGPKSGLNARVIDIVVVDDDPDTLELMRTFLRQQQCSVRIARNVREAIDRIREAVPDVVVSDLELGDSLNGWALAETLRSHEHTRLIARIAVSGGTVSESDLLGVFDAHLRKPIDLEELFDVIHRVTGITKSIRRPRFA